jgi:hypothetical protein
LKFAPGTLAAICAAVPAFQPKIWPFSVEKMKLAGAEPTMKLLLPLNTWPVGAPGTLTMSGGWVTGEPFAPPA